MELLELLNWRDTDVAAELGLKSSSGITNVRNGDSDVSGPMLRLMEQLVAKELEKRPMQPDQLREVAQHYGKKLAALPADKRRPIQDLIDTLILSGDCAPEPGTGNLSSAPAVSVRRHDTDSWHRRRKPQRTPPSG